jgi:hypothetical protein
MALSILYRLCLTPNFDGCDKGFPSLSTGAATHMSPQAVGERCDDLRHTEQAFTWTKRNLGDD